MNLSTPFARAMAEAFVRGVTADVIAERVGVSTPTLWLYKRPDADPKLSVARLLSAVLSDILGRQVTIDDLFPPKNVVGDEGHGGATTSDQTYSA